MEPEEIRKTETCLGCECLKTSFDVPHPASKQNHSDKRTVPVYIEVVKSGIEETEIRIRFNRFKVGRPVALETLGSEILKKAMREGRFAGDIPLIPTEYEKQSLEDYRHDEFYSPKEVRENW
jgi:hypothetical protein